MTIDCESQRQDSQPGEGNPLSLLLIGLASLLGGMAAYAGISALVSGSLSTRFHLGRSSPPMFPTVLHGIPAVLAGVSLIALAASIFSICATYPPMAARLPAWTRRFRWWLFAISMAFYFAAMHAQRI